MTFFCGGVIEKKRKMTTFITFFDGFVAKNFVTFFGGFAAKKATTAMLLPSSMVMVL
jgi:hypothetical protein